MLRLTPRYIRDAALRDDLHPQATSIVLRAVGRQGQRAARRDPPRRDQAGDRVDEVITSHDWAGAAGLAWVLLEQALAGYARIELRNVRSQQRQSIPFTETDLPATRLAAALRVDQAVSTFAGSGQDGEGDLWMNFTDPDPG